MKDDRALRPLPVLFRPVISVLVLALAASAHIAAQSLTLEAFPNPAPVYQKVTLSVVVPADNPDVVNADFPANVSEVHVVSGPYVQPYTDGTNPGAPEVRVSFVIEGNEGGRVVIPPLTVTVGGRVSKTKPIVMAFGLPRGGGLTVPLQPVWMLPRLKSGVSLYPGEAIPVVLELRNELAETKATSVRLSQTPAALKQAPDFSSARKRVVDKVSLYDVPVRSYILTPVSAGTITLPAATVEAGDRSGSAVPRAVPISPLPGAVSTTGAIGALSFRSWATTRTVVGGEEISLHLRVEGTGNLPRIVMPAPFAGNLLEVDKHENQSITPGSTGYRGFREIVYRYLFQAEASGDSGSSPAGATSSTPGPVRPSTAIVVPSFSWLDPESGTVETVPEKTFSFALPAGAASTAGAGPAPSATSAPPTAGGAAAERELGAIPFRLRPPASIRGSEYHELYSHSDTYLWLLPGPIIFGIFLLLRPRGRRGAGGLAAAVFIVVLASCRVAPIHDSVWAGASAYQGGDFKTAAADFLNAQKAYPRNAALSYDLALAEYRLGRYGEAIHSLRTAIYLAPLSPTYRRALAWMVKQIGVPEQVPAAYPIHPDLFLIALIVAVNAAAVLGILVMVRRTGGLAIALILLLVLAVISAGGLGYTAIKRSVETAVVRSSGTEMTKIPMAVAGRWLELPAGMAVRVLDDADGYYLVETAYGNTGWVKKDKVLVDGRTATKALSISAK